MAQSTLAILILAAALVLYAVPRIPLSVTTVFAMLAMAMSGIISYGEAFSGFANPAVLLVAGMMIIGQACFSSGLAQRFGRLLFKSVGTDEKRFMLLVFMAAALLGSAVLILTGCIGEREAFRSVSWSTIVVVAGALGFSQGLDKSGAGELIARFTIRLFGPLGQSPFGLCIVLLFLGSLLSNLMSGSYLKAGGMVNLLWAKNRKLSSAVEYVRQYCVDYFQHRETERRE